MDVPVLKMRLSYAEKHFCPGPERTVPIGPLSVTVQLSPKRTSADAESLGGGALGDLGYYLLNFAHCWLSQSFNLIQAQSVNILVNAFYGLLLASSISAYCIIINAIFWANYTKDSLNDSSFSRLSFMPMLFLVLYCFE